LLLKWNKSGVKSDIGVLGVFHLTKIPLPMEETMTTVAELELALDAKGWEPDYREETTAGEPLDAPVYELVIDEEKVLNIELTHINGDGMLTAARVWIWDEEEETIDDVWDIEDLSSPESIISEVENFADSL